jgi:hypothetical protein
VPGRSNIVLVPMVGMSLLPYAVGLLLSFALQIYEAIMTGLQPETKYYYRLVLRSPPNIVRPV